MNNKSFVFGFIIGGITSSIGTYLYFKNRNEQLIEKEIEEVKTHYNEKYTMNKEDTKEDKECKEINSYKDVISENEYNGKDIEVINEYEFASGDEFDKIGIIKTKDDIFIYDDGSNEPIEDIESVLGEGYEKNLPKDDNSTYFRDYKLKCDYEVLYDERRYNDIV